MSTGGRPKANDLFTALAHPRRRTILRKMIEEGGDISPRELAATLDEPLSALSYHVRVLAECKAVELARTKRIRGSTQHFYRSSIEAEWARSALRASEGRSREDRSRGEEKG